MKAVEGQLAFWEYTPAVVKEKRLAMSLTVYGETKSVAEWAVELDVHPGRLYRRIDSGYAPEAVVAKYLPVNAPANVAEIPPGEPGSLTWDQLPWCDDPWAQRLVRERGAMTLEEVGNYFRVAFTSLQQVERQALAKMRCGMELEELAGIERAQCVLEQLTGRPVSDYERAVERWRRKVEEAGMPMEQAKPRLRAVVECE